MINELKLVLVPSQFDAETGDFYFQQNIFWWSVKKEAQNAFENDFYDQSNKKNLTSTFFRAFLTTITEHFLPSPRTWKEIR